MEGLGEAHIIYLNTKLFEIFISSIFGFPWRFTLGPLIDFQFFQMR